MAVVVADQVTKALALHHLTHPVHVLGPFGLALQENSGSAFSLFTGDGTVLAVVAAVLAAGVAVLAWRAGSTLLAVAAGMVLGGALGNVADRVARGRVVDFVTLSHWPTFNLADAAITVGLVIVAVCLVWGAPARPPGGPAERPPDGPPAEPPARPVASAGRR